MNKRMTKKKKKDSFRLVMFGVTEQPRRTVQQTVRNKIQEQRWTMDQDWGVHTQVLTKNR